MNEKELNTVAMNLYSVYKQQVENSLQDMGYYMLGDVPTFGVSPTRKTVSSQIHVLFCLVRQSALKR